MSDAFSYEAYKAVILHSPKWIRRSAPNLYVLQMCLLRDPKPCHCSYKAYKSRICWDLMGIHF